jgi:hypothetical protein
MGSQLVWAVELPGMVLHVADWWEHGDASATVVAAASTMGNGPTVVAEDDVAVRQVECRPDSTSVEHL